MNAVARGLETKHYPCLYQFSQSELDDLFETLPKADGSLIQGYFRGKLFAVIGLGFLPRTFRRGLYRLLETVINPWRGKVFEKDRGANSWFHAAKGARFGFYKVVIDSDGFVSELNYDVPFNAAWLQPIRGEVRVFAKNRYLARMNYHTNNKTLRVLYFTLKPLDSTEQHLSDLNDGKS